MAPTRTKASSIGAPAQPTQSSRKGKKTWRKNIDLSTTEQFLEEQSDPLRQTASDALFVEDRSGQETLAAKQARTKRPLKSLEILQRNFGHAALVPAKKQKHAAGGVDKKMEQRLRKMVGRQQVSTQSDASAIVDRSVDVVNKSLGNVYDVWGSSSSTSTSADSKGKSKAAAAEDEWIPSTVAKPTVHVPKTLRRDDYGDIASKLPAIDLPHPGSSYNPDLESHEALIQEAYEIEKRLEENEQMDQVERDNWQAKLATIIAREAELRSQKDDDLKRYRGMDVDLPSEDAAQDDAEASDDDAQGGSDGEGAQTNEPKRKTRQQRARAKRARLQQAEALRRKQARIEAAAILQLPALKRREARLAAARAQAAEARRLEKEAILAKQGLSGLKVGKHKVPQQRIDVQTGDELSESLRTLKTEGNLFRDRYNKLQSRGVIEPRVKQMPKRRTHKLKTYETHDYKKFT